MESEMLKERAAYYRRHPSELNKLMPTEQLRIARAMEPEQEQAAISAGFQTPYRPVAEFDDLLKRKETDPAGYAAAVERLSPTTMAAYAHYIENLANYTKAKEAARSEAEEAEEIKRKLASKRKQATS